MRILAIRGSNLASLAAPFEVDLESEPLRSAGVFSIKGKTGSGKSTILDAMCLALFSDCPRLSSGGVNDLVQDASGDMVKSRDARGILRRGAVLGTAECDFLADDGVSYRASWTARRAHNRSTGKLQSVERGLTRLTDGQVIETQAKLVNEKIVHLIGLSYDEFRRSVLLAQGDFNAFLQADTAERAALLEKVTGTDIFRRISIRSYQLGQAATDDLRTIEGRIGSHEMLSDTEVEKLRGEIDRLNNKLIVDTAAADQINQAVASHTALDHAQQRLDEAQAAVVKARDAVAPLRGLRDEVTALSKIEPLRAVLARLAGEEPEEHQNRVDLNAAENELKEVSSSFEIANTTLHNAAGQLAKVEADHAEMVPLWDEALHLDIIIANETANERKAQSKHDVKSDSLIRAKSAVADTEQQIINHTAALQEAKSKLAPVPEAEAFVRDWPAVDMRFAELQRLSEADQKAAAERDMIAQNIKEQESISASAKTNEVRYIGIAENCRQLCHKKSVALEEAQANNPHGLLGNLLGAKAGMTQLKLDLARLIQAEKDLADANGGHEAATADHNKAKQKLNYANGELRVAEEREAAVRSMSDRANLAISDQAKALRAHLHDGEACLVCGATEHPALRDNQLDTLAKQFREDLAKAARARSDARQICDALEVDAKQAQARQTTALADIMRANHTLEGVRKAWISTISRESLDRYRDELSGEPDDQRLGAIIAQIDSEIAGIEGQIGSIAVLSRERDAANAELKAVEGDLRSQQDLLLQQRHKIQREHDNLKQVEQGTTGRETRRNEVIAQLATDLSILRVKPDVILADPTALHAKVGRIVSMLSSALSQIASATALIQQARLDASTGQAEIQTLMDGIAQSVVDAKSAAQACTAARKARAQLLGGLPVADHRRGFENERAAARQAHNQSAAVASKLNSDVSTLIERITAAANAALRHDTRLAGLRLEITEGCTSAGLSLQEVKLRLQKGPEYLARNSSMLKELDDNLMRVEALLAERERDLAETRAKHPRPKENIEKLAEKLEGVKSRLSKAHEAVGECSARLQRDSQDRARHASLLGELADKQRVSATWAAVNAAIGSANGDKFCRVAQAVTLGVLADRANEYLRLFKPRYRLTNPAPDLSVQVLDTHMADELRSTRSLSGGEVFLISLSLALALSSLGRQGGLTGTLFIDEGFGSLDAEDVDLAMGALEQLQGQGRTIGLISHVQALHDRVPVQVLVTQTTPGRSEVSVKLTA